MGSELYAKVKSSRYFFYLFAAVLYFLLALVRFGNITTHINTIIPGHDGDTFQNIWSIWWVNYAVFHLHQSIFYTKLLYWPIGSNLVFETMSPIGSLLSYPFQAISIPFAYNMIFLLSFPLSGIGMLILADYLIKNKYAAFFAGLVFSFGAFHIAEAYAHLDWMFIGWFPLAMYFFIKILDDNKMEFWSPLGLGISFTLTVFMGDVEQGIILCMVLFFVLLFYIASKTRRNNLGVKTVNKLVVAILIAIIAGSWGFIPLLSTSLKPGNSRIINEQNTIVSEEAQEYTLASFLLPNFYNAYITSSISVFNSTKYPLFSSVERTGYITYTILALCIFGIYKERKRSKLWIALALIFGLLALGPYIQLYKTTSKIPGPFLLLHHIPLVNVIQEPGRMGIAFFVAISMLAALGLVELIKFFDKFNEKRLLAIFAILVISFAFLIETSGSPVTYSEGLTPTTSNGIIPKFYYEIGNLRGNFSVMQLPALPDESGLGIPEFYTGQATYYTAASHKSLVGGYITRDNYTEYYYIYHIPLATQTEYPFFFNSSVYISPINENYTNQTLLALYNFNTGFITINKASYTQATLYSIEDYMKNTFGQPVYDDNSTMAFQTSNAINNALFKSFVSYYTISDWAPVSIDYYGQNITVWSPVRGGVISVYAPYNNTRTYANATISFYASSMARGYSQLRISFQSGLGPIEPFILVNVTQGFHRYDVLLPNLTRGDFGNSVFFIVTTNQSQWARTNDASDIAITNITVSKN